MKAALLTALGKMELHDVPAPVLHRDEDVLLRVEFVGLCGSDVHYYLRGRIGNQLIRFPFTLGHECSATVAAVGLAVTRVKPGDRVAVDPAMSCGQCDQCRRSRENTCRQLRFLGCPGQAEGCLSEFIIMPESSLYPLPAAVTLEQALLCEPLSIGIYAVAQAALPAQANIAILGAGPIGLSVLLAAQAQGLRQIYVTEKIPARLQAAQLNGAFWTGDAAQPNIVADLAAHVPLGLDAVFECAGQQETIGQAVELLAPGGKLMLVGIPPADAISLPVHTIRRKEITLINVRRQNRCVQPALGLVAAGKVRPDFMLTHRFTLEQTEQAFPLVARYRDGVIKALIEI